MLIERPGGGDAACVQRRIWQRRIRHRHSHRVNMASTDGCVACSAMEGATGHEERPPRGTHPWDAINETHML